MAFEELCSVPMRLAVPTGRGGPAPASAPADLGGVADADWILNSRGAEDDELLAHLAARVGFTPRVRHRVDALDVVVTLIAAGLGVALLPATAPAHPGVAMHPLGALAAHRRMHAATRSGHAAWPPVALVAAQVGALARAASSADTAGGAPHQQISGCRPD